MSVRFSSVRYSVTSSSIDMASFIDLILTSFGLAVISTMSSSLSSSSEFWEVDADRVEKNSSSQLALSSLYVGSVEVASKASTAEGVSDSDTELVSLNKEFTCTSSHITE